MTTIKERTEPVNCVVFSARGGMLATASQDKTVRLWDVDGFKEIKALGKHPRGVLSIAFSPDGATLATGCGDYVKDGPEDVNTGHVRLWDVQSGKLLHTIENNLRNVDVAVAKTPLGVVVAARRSNNRVGIWSLRTGQLVKEFPGRLSAHALDFSPDGGKLALGLWRGDTVLLDVASGRLLKEFAGTPSKKKLRMS